MRQRVAVARHPRRDVKRHQRLEHNPRVPVFIRQTLHEIVQVSLQYIEYILNVLLKSISFCCISPFFSGHKVRAQQFIIVIFPPTKMREGNVFSVCLSVHRGSLYRVPLLHRTLLPSPGHVKIYTLRNL